MKGFIALFGGTFLILLMVATMSSITDFRSTAREATYNDTTGAGVDTANVTLPLSVLDDSLSNITSVTSNNTADAPLATSFTSSTRVLVISGLHDSDSRLLTVGYRSPSLNDYPGADLAAKWWVLFLVIAIIACVVAALVSGFTNK